jgi:hypothetical protein
MDDATRDFVQQRAGDRCEYCLLPQDAIPWVAFHVEHVIARQHRGSNEIDNLALACARCNAYKGPNLSSIDPDTGEVVTLFHPRRDAWREHFAMKAGLVAGITPSGRATVALLQMNADYRVELRRAWSLLDDTE